MKKSTPVILSAAKDPGSFLCFSDLRTITEILRCAQDDRLPVLSHVLRPVPPRPEPLSMGGCCPNLVVAPPSWRLHCRLEAGATGQIRTLPMGGYF